MHLTSRFGSGMPVRDAHRFLGESPRGNLACLTPVGRCRYENWPGRDWLVMRFQSAYGNGRVPSSLGSAVKSTTVEEYATTAGERGDSVLPRATPIASSCFLWKSSVNASTRLSASTSVPSPPALSRKNRGGGEAALREAQGKGAPIWWHCMPASHSVPQTHRVPSQLRPPSRADVPHVARRLGHEVEELTEADHLAALPRHQKLRKVDARRLGFHGGLLLRLLLGPAERVGLLVGGGGHELGDGDRLLGRHAVQRRVGRDEVLCVEDAVAVDVEDVELQAGERRLHADLGEARPDVEDLARPIVDHLRDARDQVERDLLRHELGEREQHNPGDEHEHDVLRVELVEEAGGLEVEGDALPAWSNAAKMATWAASSLQMQSD